MAHVLTALKQHGVDAVSFQSLESHVCWWRDPDTSTGAAVPYLPSGRSWIAVGSPLAATGQRAQVARRFADAARAAGCRAVFFGVEDLAPFDGFARLQLGRQPVLNRESWTTALARHSSLREQLRRARAKGVTARVVAPEELAPGAPLRRAVDRLCATWLDLRSIEPMRFLLTIEPFHAPEEHLYAVAERDGVVVEFLSAVPIYQRKGWLLEDVFRSRAAPNGTTELMIDTAVRAMGPGHWLTPGLTPLIGPVPWWLRWSRIVTRPLYDFDGLRRFRARLRPARWDAVWLVWDRGLTPLVILDVLRGFAGGRLIRFAWQSLTQHPNGPPWAVALPLMAWTLLMAVCAAGGYASLFGFSPLALVRWVAFDAALAGALFAVSRRPRVGRLLWLAAAAGIDALWSVRHLANAGLGDNLLSAGLRLVATIGPIVGTAALLLAAFLALGLARSEAG